MPTAIVNYYDHKQLRVKPPGKVEYLQGVHMLPIVIPEVAHAGSDYPVVFVKREDLGRFQLVAVMGLSAGENLFVRNGEWQGVYMPAIIQNVPFKLARDEVDRTKMVLGIDMDSDRVSETEGEALFDETGAETEFLGRVKESVGKYYEHDQMTRAFVDAMEDFDLISPYEMQVRVGDQAVNLEGIFSVDEDKLKSLPDEKFADLRNNNLLPLLYAQIFSLNQFHRLAKMKAAAP